MSPLEIIGFAALWFLCSMVVFIAYALWSTREGQRWGKTYDAVNWSKFRGYNAAGRLTEDILVEHCKTPLPMDSGEVLRALRERNE